MLKNVKRMIRYNFVTFLNTESRISKLRVQSGEISSESRNNFREGL